MAQIWNLLHKSEHKDKDEAEKATLCSSNSNTTIHGESDEDQSLITATDDSYVNHSRKSKPKKCHHTHNCTHQHHHSSSTGHLDNLEHEHGIEDIPEDGIMLTEGIDTFTNTHDNAIAPNTSGIFSPSSLVSSSSSNIFERSVQDQHTIPSMSRRNSFNKMGAIQRTKSFSLSPTQTFAQNSHSCGNCSNIPSHLNSEDFVPTCLDASTEILTDDKADLSNLEVIQSSSFNLTDFLDQTYNKKRASRSLPLTRRQSSISAIASFSPINTDNDNMEDVDYSDKKRLNFCSFADLVNDEFESNQLSRVNTNTTSNLNGLDNNDFNSNLNSSFTMSPVSRKNSTIFVAPVSLNLTKIAATSQDEA